VVHPVRQIAREAAMAAAAALSDMGFSSTSMTQKVYFCVYNTPKDVLLLQTNSRIRLVTRSQPIFDMLAGEDCVAETSATKSGLLN
jgi:hypothetical protein